MALQRMLSRPRSTAKALVNPWIPALEAQYAACSGLEPIPSIDPMLMMLPPHLWHQCPAQECRRTQIDSHHAIPILLGHVIKGFFEHEPGVVDQDIDSAELLLRYLRDPANTSAAPGNHYIFTVKHCFLSLA
jgi:hypothetical protein